VFDHVGIIGFAFGYNNANTVNLPEITWLDPFFGSNVVAFTNGTNTNNTFLGGFFVGNATAIQSTATPGGEYQMDGVSFAVNNGPLLDFTRSTTRVIFSCFACHFEDSPVVNAGTPHFITGLVSARIYGGAMETDQASGTQDWFISIAAGGSLEVHGLDLFSAGKTFTQAFLLNTTARGNAQITNNNTTAFPTILGGAGAAGSILGQVATNTNAILQVNGSSVAGIFTGVNVTPVTVNTNTTGDQNLMALTITAGALNSLSRTLLIQLAGVYSTPAGSTAVLTHKLKLCTVSGCGSGTVITLVTWTTSALGAIQVTNNPYNATLNATTQTAGASAAFEAHGNLTIDLAALAAAAESIFADNNTATVGTIDSTAQLFLQHTVAFSAGSASNTDTDRQMIADTVD